MHCFWSIIFQILILVFSLGNTPAHARRDFNGSLTSSKLVNQLVIPALGISAPILFADSVDEKTFQALLKNGVVHYPQTALPGEVGNVYIFGHSSDYWWESGNYKTVFEKLPKIKIGDSITLFDSRGQQFTYEVYETKVIEPTDTAVLDQTTVSTKTLTLQTSYPIGTARQRFIVVAKLVL